MGNPIYTLPCFRGISSWNTGSLWVDASYSAFDIHSILNFVSFGGGFFCALSNSAANLDPIVIDSFAVAIRKKAMAVFSEDRSTGMGVLSRANSFLKLLLVIWVGVCCVTAR